MKSFTKWLAVIVAILFVSSCLPSAGEEPTNASPTAAVVKPSVHIPDTSEILDNIQDLLEMNEISFRDDLELEYLGCEMTQSYTAAISGENSYAERVAEYKDEEARVICRDQNIVELYLETYRIGDEVISRQYRGRTYYRLGPESSFAIAFEPHQHIHDRFIGTETLEVVSGDIQNGSAVVTFTYEYKGYRNEMTFTYDEAGKIKEIEYMFNLIDGGKLNGDIQFKEPYSIFRPSFFEGEEPDFIPAALHDILSYLDATYSVNTATFAISTNTYQNAELYASIYELPEVLLRCELDHAPCRLTELTSGALIDNLEPLLQNARVDYCLAPGPVNREDTGPTHASDEYQGRLNIEIFNIGRIEGDDYDHSIEVDFVVEDRPTGEYSGTLQYGKKFCFRGAANRIATRDFLDSLTEFVESLR